MLRKLKLNSILELHHPQDRVITYVCSACGKGTSTTSRGDRPIPTAELEAQRCDAEVVDPGGRRRRSIPPATRARVLARDGHRCRVRGCMRTSFLELHHQVPVARGGTNHDDNLVTLCSSCHRHLHEYPERCTRVLTQLEGGTAIPRDESTNGIVQRE